jgi:hypothetical protein
MATIVRWFVRLVTLVVAFDTLGLPAVSGVLQQLVLWLPNLVVGLVVLVIGGVAANALSRLVRGAAAHGGFTEPDLLAGATRIAVWAFAIGVAVSQLGIATALINTILIGIVGAVALAAGLAFGLAGRERAGQVLDRLGTRSSAAPGWRRPVTADAGSHPANGTVPSMVGPAELFEEDWTPRASSDRRRVVRTEADRRSAWPRQAAET